MFEEMGWTVSATCGDTAISGLSAENDGPTIFGSATQLSADVTSGNNVTYTWDFGDGTSGSGQSVSHQYAAPGPYTAEVTATNSVNQETATTSVLVQVAIGGLIASNDGPTPLGAPTQLSASVSSGSEVSYIWDFGDSTIGSGASASHTYSVPGVYVAEVTASNLVSQSTVTTEIQVQEEITGLSATDDGPTLLGMPTQFSTSIASGSSVSYAWDFGDGEVGSGADVSHVYGSPGNYTVELAASNLVSQEKISMQVIVVEQYSWIYFPLQVKSP
jgi:PKD repeat protein